MHNVQCNASNPFVLQCAASSPTLGWQWYERFSHAPECDDEVLHLANNFRTLEVSKMRWNFSGATLYTALNNSCGSAT